MRYIDEFDREDSPTRVADFNCGRHVDAEIWRGQSGDFEVRLFCKYPRAKWWQWWRSDLQLQKGKQRGISDALKFAHQWVRWRGDYHPLHMELKVTFTESD